LASPPQGLHLLHALRGQFVQLDISLHAGPAGAQPDGHALGAVALVDGHKLALDHHNLAFPLGIPHGAFRHQAIAADLHLFIGHDIRYLVADLDLLGRPEASLVLSTPSPRRDKPSKSNIGAS
jgi:hypothetical protein